MLFLGIDQHARQLTVSVRDQHGDVGLARQVSTQSEKILDFFDQTRCCAQCEDANLPPLGAIPDEVVKPIGDRIEVKSYVGGLVKSFERKVA